MPYIVLVILTLLKTGLMFALMGLPVWDAAPYTLRIWSNYAFFALLIWTPLLFTNRRRWTYIVSLLVDIWFIGIVIYFRSYGDILNRWCLDNIGNMDGIWDSIVPFMHWWDGVFIVLTIIWILLSELWLKNTTPLSWKRVLATLCLLILSALPQTLVSWRTDIPVNPFSDYYADVSMGRVWYIHSYGPIAQLCNEVINLACHREAAAKSVSDEEIVPYRQAYEESSAEQGNILLVFFESLEDWTIGLSVDGVEVTPNINRLITHSRTAHYAISAQVKEGKSSDAQLMVFNGLMPIHNGAAAMRYATNTYPSWVKYAKAEVKQLYAAYPWYMWNQRTNAESYGFDNIYAEDMSDGSLADSVINAIRCSHSPFIITAITMASHTPFIRYADNAQWKITSTEYSDTQKRYLQCVHYTDSAIGDIINTIIDDELLANNTRIVIMGDHPIFSLDTPVPLIIYDPFVASVTATRPLYQIDIYTTIIERLHIATPWHGLGHNITDSCTYTPTEIKTIESLSDRIIRTNYFSK